VIELVAAMESCSLREAGLRLAAWYGIEMSEGSKGAQKPPAQDSPGQPEASPARVADDRYGIYDPLAEWIEVRAANESLSQFEKAAYIAVLGQIEVLVSESRS
jgi:hypothetical protein